MDLPAKFRGWIRNLIFGESPHGTCIEITLKHISGKTTSDVSKFTVPKHTEIDEGEVDARCDLFASELWEAAQNDANAFSGMQTYSFYSWFDGSPDKPINRYSARFKSLVDEDEEELGDESATEPPTGMGLVQASMRHAEAFARIGTQASIHQLSMQQRTIESQQRLIEKLTNEKMETLTIMEELHSRKHERDMEMKEQEARVRVKTEFMERVAPLLPIVAAKLTGAPLLAAGKQTPAVKELLASVTEDQFGQLSAILRPEQQALLANMMQEQLAEQDEEKQQTQNGAH